MLWRVHLRALIVMVAVSKRGRGQELKKRPADCVPVANTERFQCSAVGAANRERLAQLDYSVHGALEQTRESLLTFPDARFGIAGQTPAPEQAAPQQPGMIYRQPSAVITTNPAALIGAALLGTSFTYWVCATDVFYLTVAGMFGKMEP